MARTTNRQNGPAARDLVNQPAVESRPTPEAIRAYHDLVDEIVFGERAQFRETNRSRAEIEAILEAAHRTPYELATEVDDLRRRWR